LCLNKESRKDNNSLNRIFVKACVFLYLVVEFFKHFWLGVRSFGKAIPFIIKHRLYFYILLPALIMILLYKGGEMLVGRQSFSEVNTISEILNYLTKLLIDISLGILLMTFAKFIVVIILSPLLTYLSERCDTLLTGNKYHFNLDQFWRDIQRAIRIALRNIVRQYLIILPIYFIAWLFWKNPTSSPVMFLVFLISSYYYGFSFIDYINERRKLDVKNSIQFVRKTSGLAISIGGCYAVLIFGPVDIGVIFSLKGYDPLNVSSSLLTIGYQLILWFLASAAPILGIVAATLAMYELGHLKSNALQ
jgi:CysZ protein